MQLARTWRELAERMDPPWTGEAANDGPPLSRTPGA